MTRKIASERHQIAEPINTELMDMLIVLHHPTRRWLAELLWLEGPATVGRLAARTGLAVGSMSHRLKPLYRQGFIEPAPALARDTRESWWRATSRTLSWSPDDFESDSIGRKGAERAEVEHLRFQLRAMRQRHTDMDGAPIEWRLAAGVTDGLVKATADKAADLHRRQRATPRMGRAPSAGLSGLLASSGPAAMMMKQLLRPRGGSPWTLGDGPARWPTSISLTLTYGSWMNLVERWFSALTAKKLQRSAHRTVKDLAADIRSWAETWNDNSKPFTWHKSADDILQRLAGYCTASTNMRPRQP